MLRKSVGLNLLVSNLDILHVFIGSFQYQYLIRKGTSRLICHVDGLITIPAQTPRGREPCDEIESSSTFGDLVRGVEEFHISGVTSAITESQFISVARPHFCKICFRPDMISSSLRRHLMKKYGLI